MVKSEIENKSSSQELVVKPLVENESKFPVNWNHIEHLSYKTSIYNSVLIDLDSEEAVKIISKITETLTNVKVHSIERVQNLVAYTRYQINKELLTK